MCSRENRLIEAILMSTHNIPFYCLFSRESPHRGNSNEYTQYTIFNIKKKITLNYLKFVAMGVFPGTHERV